MLFRSPQIEVKFDIDQNGILHVTAKDLGTRKEATVRIEQSSGLSEAEIEKMKKDAEAHASDDEARRRGTQKTVLERKAPEGTTANDFTATMALARADADSGTAKSLPTVEDVANTIVFLGSDESMAFSAQGFEVTNGMQVVHESRSTWVSRPELRTVDGTGSTVLVAAGDQVMDALAIARIQAGCGARVLLGLGSEEAVQAARAALRKTDADRRIEPVLFDRHRPESRHAAKEEALFLMREGNPIHVFPEGTRSRDGQLARKAHLGMVAACHAAGTPVLPVALQGTERLIPPDAWGTRWGQTVRLTIGDVVVPGDFPNADAFAAEAWRRVGHLLQPEA